MLWTPENGGGRRTALDGVYLFLVWGGLIAVARLLAPGLAAPDPLAGGKRGDGGEGEGEEGRADGSLQHPCAGLPDLCDRPLSGRLHGRSGRAAAARPGCVRRMVYTLSLSIYCTAWTFYGAVGYAARSGLEFVTIYLGPTLVFVGWWWVLRKLVRIGKVQRVTSIADLISSRYGKSNLLGVIVTIISVVAATPYIALQLQSVTLSFGVFASATPEGWAMPDRASTALWVAVGLALFTVLFGTRNLDANERHHGVVTAIAVEAVVKLVALVAVGIFVVWGLADGPVDMMARIDSSRMAEWHMQPGRWAGLIFLSAAAVLCLPRMFQVMVVENVDERHLATASWAFPLYLFAMSLFVVPIAVMGLDRMPDGANPDLFVLTLPLSQGQGGLAMLAFLGGFSSATSMVIVASIALATMVSNHIVMPVWLWLRPARAVSGDVRRVVLRARRLSIAGVVALGYAYFRLSGGSEALAAIGLISFVGVAQILPAMLGGLFWRGATRVGAVAGLLTGAGDLGLCAVSAILRAGGGDSGAGDGRGAVGPWLAAPAGAVRRGGDGPADPCDVLVAGSERDGVLPRVDPDLSRSGGAGSGGRLRECLRRGQRRARAGCAGRSGPKTCWCCRSAFWARTRRWRSLRPRRGRRVSQALCRTPRPSSSTRWSGGFPDRSGPPRPMRCCRRRWGARRFRSRI